MFVSLQDFFENYRIKNGKQPNETTLNRGIMRLKREVRELESVFNIILGNDLPEWDPAIYYEVDEYVQYNGLFYKSTVSQNLNAQPDLLVNWEHIDIDFSDIRNLLPSKADVGTTLADYGILDAYTQDQIDQQHADILGEADPDFNSFELAKIFVQEGLDEKTSLVEIPASPKGLQGDVKGSWAIDDTWVYVCMEDWADALNTRPIWKRIELPQQGSGVQWTFGDAWNDYTTYYIGDFVTHSGSTWDAIADNVDTEPGVDAGWENSWSLRP